MSWSPVSAFRSQLRAIRAEPAGGRFKARARAFEGRHPFVRIGVAFIGFSIMAMGVLMLVFPGPGLLFLLVGLALLGVGFRPAANLLDTVEIHSVELWMKLPEDVRSSRWIKYVIFTSMIIGAILTGLITYYVGNRFLY